jgi:hypothetical protein
MFGLGGSSQYLVLKRHGEVHSQGSVANRVGLHVARLTEVNATTRSPCAE